jgi:hypothetical protein
MRISWFPRFFDIAPQQRSRILILLDNEISHFQRIGATESQLSTRFSPQSIRWFCDPTL